MLVHKKTPRTARLERSSSDSDSGDAGDEEDEEEDDEDEDEDKNVDREEYESPEEHDDTTTIIPEGVSVVPKRLRPRSATCKHCSEEFDVTNNGPEDCTWHDGTISIPPIIPNG